MINLILKKLLRNKSYRHRPLSFLCRSTKKETCPLKRSLLQNDIMLGQLSRGFFHDLLNPLNALSLYTETLMKQKSCISSREVFLEIQSELHSFIRIIQTNLRNPMQRERCSFHDLCLGASQLLKFKLQERDVRVVIIGDSTLELRTSPVYVSQILSNLISNAVDSYKEHSKRERKTISIVYEERKGRLHVSVIDKGKGIPHKMQKKIFTPYLTTKKDGHGIGLVTVKYIIEKLLRGDISINSSEQEGTTVHFDLPMDHQSPGNLGHLYQYQKSSQPLDHL